MTLDPVVVRGAETIESAARMLLARKVRRLPVVDGDGRLIGLFSRSDVMKVALAARQAALGGGV
jgi:CBS domain-containing protein